MLVLAPSLSAVHSMVNVLLLVFVTTIVSCAQHPLPSTMPDTIPRPLKTDQQFFARTFGAARTLTDDLFSKRGHDSSKVAVDSSVRKRIENALSALSANDIAPAGVSDKACLADLVNPFIGTGATDNPGNVFPGASIPFGMAKIGIDLDVYAPAGYNDNVTAPVRGMSLLHDTGTGSDGSYGVFESMPIVCKNDQFKACTTSLDDRKRKRQAGKDSASPGYFTLTLDNGIQLEATSTRRAGLLRYTWPKSLLESSKSKPHVVFDWSNDLPGTFRGGVIDADWDNGRIRMNGSWQSSFGPGPATYRAYACYDLLNNGQQTLARKGLWAANRYGLDAKIEDAIHSNQTRGVLQQPLQAGALVSWDKTTDASSSSQVLIRVGLSFVSADRACDNAEDEIPKWDFDAVRNQSRSQWDEKLRRVEISPQTDRNIVELLYSSLYRQFLSPNNATLEGQKEFLNTKSFYFDGLYCSWDTFRTFYPLLALHSPQDFGEIVESYIDGYRKLAYIPECRANNLPGYTQGGSNGVNILAHFAVTYGKSAEKLGVDMDTMYKALLDDAYITPAEWDTGGRQVGAYMQYRYVPFDAFDVTSTGLQTREASRTLEYSFNDFSIRQVALLRKDASTADIMSKRALYYRNTFDKDQKSEGFSTFVNKRYATGPFYQQDPTKCTPNSYGDCSIQYTNTYGVYESSSWEYSFWSPHDGAGIVDLLSGNDTNNFIDRIDHFFQKGYFNVGNEPSFSLPTMYHYVGQPARSVQRVREIVYDNFNTTNAGLPGNDDNGAMATLLIFHLLGLFPIPATQEFLLVSPFLPSYTFHNSLLGDLTVSVTNFDPSTLNRTIPNGARAYVDTVKINGVAQSSRCKLSFTSLFPSGGNHTVVELVMTADSKHANSCGPSPSDLPSSLSTGGFA